MYRIRIPAEIKDNGYYMRREPFHRISSSYYEIHIESFADLTVSEHVGILNKIANIGGMGNLRVTKLENNASEEK